ncbi:putative zinc transporter msc2, partial [Ascosphaera pollenicola]
SAAMRELYMKQGQGFLLVFSITSQSSLNELAELREQIIRIKDDEKVPLVIVGNKSDLEEDRQVPRSTAFALSKEWGNAPYYETSARRRANVNEVFVDLCRQIIRKDIEQSPESNKEYLNSLYSRKPGAEKGPKRSKTSTFRRRKGVYALCNKMISKPATSVKAPQATWDMKWLASMYILALTLRAAEEVRSAKVDPCDQICMVQTGASQAGTFCNMSFVDQPQYIILDNGVGRGQLQNLRMTARWTEDCEVLHDIYLGMPQYKSAFPTISLEC